jgi:hypothetical protein
LFPKQRDEHFQRSRIKRFRVSKHVRVEDEGASDFGEDSGLSDAEEELVERESSAHPDLSNSEEVLPSSPTTLSVSSDGTDGDETLFYDLEPWQKYLEHLVITTPHDILIHDITSQYMFTHTVRFLNPNYLGYHA